MMVISYHSAGFGFFLLSGMCCVDVAMFRPVIDTANCLTDFGMSPNCL